MKVKYLYELKYYSESYLEGLFKENYHKVIEELGKKEIIKSQGDKLAFEYVGLVSVGEILVSFLPKFLLRKLDTLEEQENTVLTMKVLKKYSIDQKDSLSLTQLDEFKGLNKLSLIDFLFKDYIEYGLYESNKEIREHNGDGEIDWEKTVEETDPIFQKNNPYYINWYSIESEANKNSYVRRVHQSVLIKALEYIEDGSLKELISEIIDIPNFDFHNNEEGLGDADYQIQMIEKSLRVEFYERKINLLKSLKAFLKNDNKNSNDSVELLGLRKFHSVWEKVCQSVYKDQYSKNSSLKEIMKRYTQPKWKKNGNGSSMIPDLVILEEDSLKVLDAKYYNPSRIKENLGVQDILKQFVYEDVFRKEYGDKYTYTNYLLVPGLEDLELDTITMDYFNGREIKVLQCNYQVIFENYIKNKNIKKV